MHRSWLVLTCGCVVFLASLTGLMYLVESKMPEQQMQGSVTLTGHTIEIHPPAIDEPTNTISGSVIATFTYQGVLTDLLGAPVVGPVSLEFLVMADPVDGGARIPISGSFKGGIMPDASGRFQVEVELPTASIMSTFENFGLRVTDPSDGSTIIDDLTLSPTPFAWLSERARHSDTATFADTAGSADSAAIAEHLVNDQVHVISLNPDFGPAPVGQAPRAARVGDVVMLTGNFSNLISLPNGSPIGTLPVGMRPSETVTLAVHVSLSDTSGNAALVITSSGTMSLISPNYSPGFTFFLNGANFIVE